MLHCKAQTEQGIDLEDFKLLDHAVADSGLVDAGRVILEKSCEFQCDIISE